MAPEKLFELEKTYAQLVQESSSGMKSVKWLADSLKLGERNRKLVKTFSRVSDKIF